MFSRNVFQNYLADYWEIVWYAIIKAMHFTMQFVF